MEEHAVSSHDSLIPMIAEERAAAMADAGGGVFHAAVAGGVGGLVAGLLGGVPYFLAYPSRSRGRSSRARSSRS